MTKRDISGFDVTACKCKALQKFSYAAGEEIMKISELGKRICFVEKGSAHISFYDNEGRVNIVEFIDEGDCFGDFFISLLTDQEYTVRADKDCEIIFVDYTNVLDKCSSQCSYHPELVKSMFLMTTRKAKELAIHLNILSQRSLRAKILAFLEYSEGEKGGRTTDIGMSLGNMAEYLCVDRSAMMREIKKMNEEDLISSSGRLFTVNLK